MQVKNFLPLHFNIKHIILLICTTGFSVAMAQKTPAKPAPKPAAAALYWLDLSPAGINAQIQVPKDVVLTDDVDPVTVSNGKDFVIRFTETSETFEQIRSRVKNNDVRRFVQFVQEDDNGFIAEMKPLGAREYDFIFFVTIEGKTYVAGDPGTAFNEALPRIKAMYASARSIKPAAGGPAAAAPVFYTGNFTQKIEGEVRLDCNTLNDLGVVVPLTARMKKYDCIMIGIRQRRNSDYSIELFYMADLFPGTPSFEQEYGGKKELRFLLFDKSNPKKTSPLFMIMEGHRYRPEEPGAFQRLFCSGNETFNVSVYGGMKTGETRWNDDQSKLVPVYNYKIIAASNGVEQAGKVVKTWLRKRDASYVDYAIIEFTGGVEITREYGDDITLSNGYEFEIDNRDLDKRTMEQVLKEKKKEHGERIRDSKIKIAEEGNYYFIYTRKTGGILNKSTSAGICFMLPPPDKFYKYLHVFHESDTLTVEDFKQRLEFLKKSLVYRAE